MLLLASYRSDGLSAGLMSADLMSDLGAGHAVERFAKVFGECGTEENDGLLKDLFCIVGELSRYGIIDVTVINHNPNKLNITSGFLEKDVKVFFE